MLAFGYALVRGLVVLSGAVEVFNLDFSRADIPAALAVLAASTVPLIGLAIFTSVLPLLSPQKGEQMSVAVQGFLLLVSGVYYPLTVLPWPMQLAGAASPLTYALQGIRDSLLDGKNLPGGLHTHGIRLRKGGWRTPAGRGRASRGAHSARHQGRRTRRGAKRPGQRQTTGSKSGET